VVGADFGRGETKGRHAATEGAVVADFVEKE